MSRLRTANQGAGERRRPPVHPKPKAFHERTADVGERRRFRPVVCGTGDPDTALAYATTLAPAHPAHTRARARAATDTARAFPVAPR
ncbi:hypothetical protein AB0L14_17295 [Streptomyces sp. NPDC052727]|uniref:hypothetical protein n=1 Tax=Streptomyces sp. NPDC052727 TaxID=3154854 RepID=UPI00343C40D4